MKPLVLDAKLINPATLRRAIAVLAGQTFLQTVNEQQMTTIYTVITYITYVLDEYKEQYPGEE